MWKELEKAVQQRNIKKTGELLNVLTYPKNNWTDDSIFIYAIIAISKGSNVSLKKLWNKL